MARTQYFTPFTPELLGALSGARPPAVRPPLRGGRRSQSDPLSDLRTHYFGLGTPLLVNTFGSIRTCRIWSNCLQTASLTVEWFCLFKETDLYSWTGTHGRPHDVNWSTEMIRFSSHSRIFHSYGDVTITSDRQQNLKWSHLNTL